MIKIQVSFNMLDLEKAVSIAETINPHVDILEIGPILLYKYGTIALETFKKSLPKSTILVNAKIVDRSRQAVPLFSQSGADWITVMSGTDKKIIHTACTLAHQDSKKIMLDLTDSCSIGQTAMDAKSMGVDALLMHRVETDESLDFLDNWNMAKGNTELPIFISGKITEDNLDKILPLSPAGIVVGGFITQAENPAETAEKLSQLIKKD